MFRRRELGWIPFGSTTRTSTVLRRRRRSGSIAARRTGSRESRSRQAIPSWPACTPRASSSNRQDAKQKRAIEHAIWLSNGWDGHAPVTRVEFQGRGVFLDEINLRDPRLLPEKLDPVFQRGVRWVRLIDPDSSVRRTRCALDERWQVVTDTVFSHAAAPIERSRAFRGGARPSHVSGRVQSALASTGLLRPPPLVTADGRTFEDAAEFAEHLDHGAAVEWVHKTYRDMFRGASDLCADDAVARFGPHDAVIAVATKNEAARARFWSHDDLKGLKK